jgi:chorismate-pyruvate lyase
MVTPSTMSEATYFTRLQRILLGTDGTVTHILEAYADEPVDVVKLRQEYDTVTPADALLELPPEATLLRRRILLRGRRTGQTLLYAEVAVAADRVGAAILDGLINTDKPVGVILAENREETFREILVADREPAGACGSHFGLDPNAVLIFRTYRIFAHEKPIMLITEKFPEAFFRDLPA